MTADVGTPSVWPGGLSELRFFFDSGLRIYYTIRNAEVVILLVGGDKSSQDRDLIDLFGK